MKYLVGLTAALTALFSGSAFAEGETIAVFTKNLTNPYFQAVRVGTETAAKALAVKRRSRASGGVAGSSSGVFSWSEGAGSGSFTSCAPSIK